ncbi:hypothetical protein [Flavobacterium cerinum]|nr:hypothetical protein [Flavobacterium cerinum]
MEARAGGVGFLSGLGADIAGVKTSFFDGPIAPNPKAKRKETNFSGQLEGLPPPPSTVLENPNEPPVNLFRKTEEDGFLDIVKDFEKSAVTGDNVFRVLGHGNVGLLQNDSDYGSYRRIQKVEHFNEMMSEASPQFKKIAGDKNAIFTLILYACLSGKSDPGVPSIAETISKAYPNATVIGFDGYLYYGGKNGLRGVSSDITKNLKDGNAVYFRNGQQTKKLSTNQYFKKKK